VSLDYDPWHWDGPAFARRFLSPPEPVPAAASSFPPDVALPNGAYSYCFNCSTKIAPSQRCTEPAQLAKLRSAAPAELLAVACCPLDLADEIATRRERRAVVYEPLPQTESKPSRWRRWWRRKE
jgi:hypothetical protein